MEKIKNLSLKKTIILYMVINLLCTFLLYAVIVKVAERSQRTIWAKYIDLDAYYEADIRSGDNYDVSIPTIPGYEMSDTDRFLSDLCDFLQTYSILVLSIIGSCITVSVFYRHKLKTPIEELHNASMLVAGNELDFQITYENKDELGQLCKEFERMRQQLSTTYKMLWKQIEDEKILRAAMAHDIRSPLAVLSGYQEMLLEFAASKDIDQAQMVEMIQAGQSQLQRINNFVETMRKLSSIEHRELQYTKQTLGDLFQRISNEVNIMNDSSDLTCKVSLGGNQLKTEIIEIDTDLVLEVFENLFTNALRYANELVQIVISKEHDTLSITLIDDGIGFYENTEKLTQPYYHSNLQDDLKHFGMGMYLSKVYCEKHGGRLLVGNQESKGGVVKAIFMLHNKEKS